MAGWASCKTKDTKLERTVALKFLSLTSIGDEEKKRFRREGQATLTTSTAEHLTFAQTFLYIRKYNSYIFLEIRKCSIA